MKLLLDTHAFLWWLAGDLRLSKPARDAIDDSANDVHVSAASAWEITTKHRVGKLDHASAIAHDVGKAIASQAFQELPVTVRHAQLAGALPGEHRDPFDRMLVAQAILENMALVGNETRFDALAVKRLW